jgi:glycosyltransferase involved in cell wall biosynthesis
MPIVSVIVPVYKVEKYLRRCVDSILAQTFIDFECILIDDGSPDNCPAICDEYAARDKRIVVLHQENGGVTSARARGVQAANGEYICFVDSDDSLPENALYLLYERAKLYNLDILVTAAARKKRGFYFRRENMVEGIITSEKYIEAILLRQCLRGIWARLMKRSLFDKYTFDIPKKIFYNEDIIMNLRLALNAKNIGIFNDLITYNYIFRKDSVSANAKSEMKINKKIFFLCKEVVDKINNGPRLYDVLLRFKLRRYGENMKIDKNNIDELKKVAYTVERLEGLNIYEKEIITRILHYKYRYFITAYFFLKKICLRVKNIRNIKWSLIRKII